MDTVYIEVSAGVRYWEDATVNGQEDAEGTLIPFRDGDNWRPVIRLCDGMVMQWPQGMDANVYYKVCDAGEYWLRDEHHRRVAKWNGYYVPSAFLCHGGDGYGDYIILTIGPDGHVANWRRPAVTMVCRCGHDKAEGWVELEGRADG